MSITAYRRENLGEPLRRLFRGIRRLTDAHPDAVVVFPVCLDLNMPTGVKISLLSSCILLMHLPDVIDFHHFPRSGQKESCKGYRRQRLNELIKI